VCCKLLGFINLKSGSSAFYLKKTCDHPWDVVDRYGLMQANESTRPRPKENGALLPALKRAHLPSPTKDDPHCHWRRQLAAAQTPSPRCRRQSTKLIMPPSPYASPTPGPSTPLTSQDAVANGRRPIAPSRPSSSSFRPTSRLQLGIPAPLAVGVRPVLPPVAATTPSEPHDGNLFLKVYSFLLFVYCQPTLSASWQMLLKSFWI
jgi:hypothetical protein